MDLPTPYAVILQYPGDGLLEENSVQFFATLDQANAYRDRLLYRDDWFKVFRVEPVTTPAEVVEP
jgi:hypothetical protein